MSLLMKIFWISHKCFISFLGVLNLGLKTHIFLSFSWWSPSEISRYERKTRCVSIILHKESSSSHSNQLSPSSTRGVTMSRRLYLPTPLPIPILPPPIGEPANLSAAKEGSRGVAGVPPLEAAPGGGGGGGIGKGGRETTLLLLLWTRPPLTR